MHEAYVNHWGAVCLQYIYTSVHAHPIHSTCMYMETLYIDYRNMHDEKGKEKRNRVREERRKGKESFKSENNKLGETSNRKKTEARGEQ